jgi:hypothetical protein
MLPLLQRAATLRLHNRKKIAYVYITIEFCLFFTCQLSLPRQLRQVIHSRDVVLAKPKGQQEFCRTR